jgi:hypothetical protein
MPILNYTTRVSAQDSVNEIQKILGRKGARSIGIDYEPTGNPMAVIFKLEVNAQEVWFRLPRNADGVLQALKRAKSRGECDKLPWSAITLQQAERISWRILKDWIEAQLALIEAGQAEMAEVFLPYAIDARGQTFFQRFIANTNRMLAGEVSA